MTTKQDISLMPDGLRTFFGSFGPQLFDSGCEEPIGWGYTILRRLGDDKWREASEYGDLECVHPSQVWVLITKWLTPDDARAQYGEVTDVVRGPQGGFKSVTYGARRFVSRRLDPGK